MKVLISTVSETAIMSERILIFLLHHTWSVTPVNTQVQIPLRLHEETKFHLWMTRWFPCREIFLFAPPPTPSHHWISLTQSL